MSKPQSKLASIGLFTAGVSLTRTEIASLVNERSEKPILIDRFTDKLCQEFVEWLAGTDGEDHSTEACIDALIKKLNACSHEECDKDPVAKTESGVWCEEHTPKDA